MITRQDLDAAIAECQGKRNPDASTCIKLAAFYTIMENMFPEDKPTRAAYSFAPAPDQTNSDTVAISSDSDFAKIVDGRKQEDVWPVIDELMDTIKVIHPRLYDAVLNKL